jgi:hypothetical protein
LRGESQDKPIIGTVVVLSKRGIDWLSWIRLDLGPISLVELPIFPHKEKSKSKGQTSGEEHERRANRHSLDETRTFFVGEYVRAEERAALADDIKKDDASSTAGVRSLVI